MTDHAAGPKELESAIAGVYRGPLEGFIGRRDALARELRASKRREDANRVKALRKPSRAAWALDQAAFEDPGSIEQLEGAIGAAQEAHSHPAGAARAAAENVSAAVRALASAGARAATRLGHRVEATALLAAVRAVIGDSRAFADLRAGRLTEIPEGGGLDALAAVTPIGPLPVKVPERAPAAERARPDDRRAEAARAAAERVLLRAVRVLEEARVRAVAAGRVVHAAETLLEAAEQELSRAREVADARRAELERARRDAERVATEVADAERTVAEARARTPPA